MPMTAHATAPTATPAATLVVGLGASGMSVVRHLAARGESFAVADSRPRPPGLDDLKRDYPAVAHHCGPFAAEQFAAWPRLVLSPGVPPQEPAVQAALAAGAEVMGDIELFARAVTAPVVAITGSNGKSTVTTLLGEMAREAGIAVAVGGNLGTPALDLLATQPELYILELSSFQLETTYSLTPQAATVLNLSADHLDRHTDMAEYGALKARIFQGDGVMVLNRDDPQVVAMALPGREIRWFGLGQPSDGNSYGLLRQEGALWLCRGATPLLSTAELGIAGLHNYANALAALALGEVSGLPLVAMLTALRRFRGLPHRCQRVRELGGVGWFDDSKGTNVGATLAALNGMPGEKVVLIAGGDGKGQAFAPLRAAVAQRARAVVLIGRDGPLIGAALADSVPLVPASDMADAVRRAHALALPGDTVLLSPACASFDMYRNYIERAEQFIAAVEGLPA